MVNLKAAPFYLSEADCKWVTDTIAAMSLEEKVGQLFFGISSSFDEDYLTGLVRTYHLGGCRYNPAPGLAVRQHNEVLQQASGIPMFIACNTEAGGDACSDGTYLGTGVKIGATGKCEYAYDLGKLANEEAAAIGCNMAFAPVCDISTNWQNTEVISRAFGRDAKQVAQMSAGYLWGAHTIPGFACAAKHFPGNGRDFRDAHFANNLNDCSVEEWDETYGQVYRTLIEADLDAVMAGHIMLPAYAKALNRGLSEEEAMLPATLSRELITGLLREKLGFNGLVLTDATHMVGMTCRMKREKMLVQAINAGCDMLLFFNDPDEDFATVLNACLDGTISEERMQDALTRILGLKAHMGLHKAKALVPSAGETEQVLRDTSRRAVARKISEDGITLVKYRDAGVLPISAEKYKRIMLVRVKGAENEMTALQKALGLKGGSPVEHLRQKLEEQGFEVFLYQNPLDVMMEQAKAGQRPDVNEFFAGKSAVSAFTAQMDLVITVCDVPTGRPSFGLSKGGGEIPWYVFEVPVIVLGLETPTMLADIPQARTYINLYDAKNDTLDVLVDKLMEGPEAFRGRDPIDSFCGLIDARL